MYDFIIKNGLVVDGIGSPARIMDIATSDDRIVAMGDLSSAQAHESIDAKEQVVVPGFIDAHAHSDTYLLIEPDAPSKLTQGITTEINGQCGGSGAPRLGQARLPSDWASRFYPRATSPMTKDKGREEGPTWSTVAEYRELFEQVVPAINSVQFIGHNTLRAGVMGYEPREASTEEIKEMQRRLQQALADGGWGLTTGLLYQPGKYAASLEIEALARTATQGAGMYASHIRNEGDTLLESVEEVLSLVEKIGIHAQISHLKTAGPPNWHKIDALLSTLNQAREKGCCVHADRYPYLASGTDLDIVLPEWAAAGGRDAILAHLHNPSTRTRIEKELDAQNREWPSIMIGGGWTPEVRAVSGRTLPEAAQHFGLTIGQTVCRIIDLDNTRTSAFFFGMSEENLLSILAQPWVMPGSDASLRAPWGVLGEDHPHPRAYGTMPKFLTLLTNQLGLSLEETIQRMTNLPATAFGIRDRGILRVGAYADIVVFRREIFKDIATYAAPHQFSTGINHVFVNGSHPYHEGQFTGQRRGRFLTRN
ncbi:MAG: D-aminoacylase [bacterium]